MLWCALESKVLSYGMMRTVRHCIDHIAERLKGMEGFGALEMRMLKLHARSCEITFKFRYTTDSSSNNMDEKGAS